MERRSFSRAFSDVGRARRLLQNGRKQDAMELLVVAAAALAHGASPSPGCSRQALVPPLDLERYRDARLLDERGMRIGEVVGLGASEATEVVLVVGGVRDFFGFLDFGGREMRASARDLVFGAHGVIGETWVVLPTSGS